MPRVRQWLEHAQASAEIVCTCYHHLPAEARWKVLVQENVLVQIEHLRTHPAVATALAAGGLKLHAWVYKIETGEVFAYDSATGQFNPLLRGEGAAVVPPPVTRAGPGPTRGGTPPVARAV
jgi:carbonic anhydrase